VTEFFNGVVD
jgi:hypothetical protein